MTDSKMLRKAVEKSGLKYNHIAGQLDLSRAGLLLKIDGKNEFKASEISKLCEVLGITNEQRERIFFKV